MFDSGCVHRPHLQHRAKIKLFIKSDTKAKTYRRDAASASAISQSSVPSTAPFHCVSSWTDIQLRRRSNTARVCVCNSDGWNTLLMWNHWRYYLQLSSIDTNNEYMSVLPHVQRLTHTLQIRTVKLFGLKRPSPLVNLKLRQKRLNIYENDHLFVLNKKFNSVPCGECFLCPVKFVSTAFSLAAEKCRDICCSHVTACMEM